MLMPNNSLIVTQIAGERAVVLKTGLGAEYDTLLVHLGFQQDGTQYVRPISDHLDRQALVRELISADALFIGGPDWSPAELVEHYRDQSRVQGSYKRIVWRSPERYEVSQA